MSEAVPPVTKEVLEVVPTIMRTIRARLRERRAADISVPQFRAMAYIDRNQDASLSALAAHIGLTLPAMSNLIDGLVNRKLVRRRADHEDRRKICLSLTAQGQHELEGAFKHTRRFLAEMMSGLPAEDLETISHAMRILGGLFRVDGNERLAPQGEREE